FERVIQKHELPSEIIEITLGPDDGEFINEDFLVNINLAASKSAAKRLFEQGGVEVDGSKITDPKETVAIKNDMVIKIGKRKIVKLKTK
ncbi:MAG: tyrosine--tRNA ligase, partial [Candidatus Levybacteria bacterium]|nr:tyrosine--tRNA ligase [Candidatus Levybacteria bacterium]